MKAMILIDGIYINNSGGLRLLEYLVAELQQRRVEFYLLADARCRGKFDAYNHVRYMSASLWDRKIFYQKKGRCFSSVLCFGNIPAPCRMDVPVYTYFHNINLLTLAETHSPMDLVKSWLKRAVFIYYKKNTDYWLVQTSNTSDELCKHLREQKKKVKLMPFFKLPKELSALSESGHGKDYVYVSTYTGAKGHEELLSAWRLLYKRGIIPKLHLTVPLDCHPFVDEIAQAQREGLQIENHGIIPFEQVIELYKQSKAIVYPSHNESLGLGIVEAITAGCDVIGSDFPFLYSICKPSQVFNPYSPESIADAVMIYETCKVKKTELNIYNHIDELIDLLIADQ